jgi:hypothetical protein
LFNRYFPEKDIKKIRELKIRWVNFFVFCVFNSNLTDFVVVLKCLSSWQLKIQIKKHLDKKLVSTYYSNRISINQRYQKTYTGNYRFLDRNIFFYSIEKDEEKQLSKKRFSLVNILDKDIPAADIRTVIKRGL